MVGVSISLWLLKVMNDVWEGNNAARALIEEKKKKDKTTKVTLEKLCVRIAIFKPLLFVSLNKTRAAETAEQPQ